MDVTTFQHFRENLLKKRKFLTDWLSTTPVENKSTRLGPADEQQFTTHLSLLDEAIEKTSTQTLGLCTVCHDYIGSELLEMDYTCCVCLDHLSPDEARQLESELELAQTVQRSLLPQHPPQIPGLEMDYTCCVCLDHLSPDEARQLESELELAQTVQRSLLPQHPPQIPGLEMAAFSRPAQIVGGDYFDFLNFNDGSHGLAIADVAGHGVSASLQMASLQTALHTLVPASDSPAAVVQRINHLYQHNINFSSFVTLFLGMLDFNARTLTYCNAGHNPPLVFHPNGHPTDGTTWLEPTGPAIGLVEGSDFQAQSIPLLPGDILLLYTDGVTEATNQQREQFGAQRLAAFVEDEWQQPARELTRALRASLEAFSVGQPLADDTTIVVCKFN